MALNNEGDFVEADRLILVDMLRALADVAALSLGHPVTSAAVSLPAHNRVHHFGEFAVEPILRNAIQTAGLEYLAIYDRDVTMGEPLVFAENTVVAGHGLGLCQPYTATGMCENGTRAPYDRYYLIGYYSNELEITRTNSRWSAYDSWWYGFPSIQNLGHEAKHDNPNEEHYWDAVRVQLIKSFGPGGSPFYNLTKLIYYGDFAEDKRLRSEVAQVLRMFREKPEIVEDAVDPVYAGALGIAEFAKRKPYFDIETHETHVLIDQTRPDL
nr:hypothetical protein B0A51_10075 [Rachicladosporium sp. CCFEE 5018]